jgi:hypothetical protein
MVGNEICPRCNSPDLSWRAMVPTKEGSGYLEYFICTQCRCAFCINGSRIVAASPGGRWPLPEEVRLPKDVVGRMPLQNCIYCDGVARVKRTYSKDAEDNTRLRYYKCSHCRRSFYTVEHAMHVTTHRRKPNKEDLLEE